MSVLVIAEAGVNHNGSIDTAKALVDLAWECGADVVKFQTFDAKLLVSRSAPKADYQKKNTETTESQFEMIQKLELSHGDHRELVKHCEMRGIEFMSSPFDLESLWFLTRELKVSRLKLGSGELTNAPLLLEAARSQLPLILSTGMSNLYEVEEALGVLAFGYSSGSETSPSRTNFKKAWESEVGKKAVREKVILLHCTTEYPAAFESVNLKAIHTLKDKFELRVGFSDHTPGIAASLGATALGSVVIEKHFTLDQSMPGPDHQASLNPHELKSLVQGVREVEIALGHAEKAVTSGEIKNKKVARKSLFTLCAVKRGEVFTAQNLTTKRPGEGIHPILFWEILGKKANHDLSEDHLILPEDFS